ncbi:hypothetical protein BLOT_003065 [Blomia tropicalis]|nr:hypothetical protein BLOT_003065 [Blomia tropicalis]
MSSKYTHHQQQQKGEKCRTYKQKTIIKKDGSTLNDVFVEVRQTCVAIDVYVYVKVPNATTQCSNVHTHKPPNFVMTTINVNKSKHNRVTPVKRLPKNQMFSMLPFKIY